MALSIEKIEALSFDASLSCGGINFPLRVYAIAGSKPPLMTISVNISYDPQEIRGRDILVDILPTFCRRHATNELRETPPRSSRESGSFTFFLFFYVPALNDLIGAIERILAQLDAAICAGADKPV